ncbi:MAG: VWA domain-containing protein [Mariprofundaceae bacterium]|nr:VWA domain-containing protein [Mariprofundaceae bacterium]
MFEFAFPWVLLLFPMPWLARRWLPVVQKKAPSGLYIPFADDFRVAGKAAKSTVPRHRIWLMLAFASWILLLLAAAKPQWLGDPVEVSRSGRDVMLAVDLSGSMQMQDFVLRGKQVDRLTATKLVAGDFIKRREGDRLGLILFGTQAYLQTPLSFDRVTVNVFLQEAAIGLAGEKTAIGDAIGLAVKRLKDKENISELVLILLTDGVNTAGELSPEEGIALAKKIGLRIHTIGIGASAMTVSSFFGNRTVNPSADLDEAMLRSIAEQTGGQYFRAHDTQELEKIYAVIDKLEPVDGDVQMFRPVQALFMFPLGLAMLLSSIILLFRSRRLS